MKNLASNFVSAILIPMLIPTYLIIIVLFFFPQLTNVVLLTEIIKISFFVFLLTAVAPLLFVFILFKRGNISSLYLKDRKDRILPQIFTLVMYFVVTMIISKIYGYSNIMTIILGTNAIALVIHTIITHYWKISAHTSSAVGLFVIMSVLLFKEPSTTYLVLYTVVCILTIAVFFARIYLKAHTAKQVIFGGLLGFLSGLLFIYFL